MNENDVMLLFVRFLNQISFDLKNLIPSEIFTYTWWLGDSGIELLGAFATFFLGVVTVVLLFKQNKTQEMQRKSQSFFQAYTVLNEENLKIQNFYLEFSKLKTIFGIFVEEWPIEADRLSDWTKNLQTQVVNLISSINQIELILEPIDHQLVIGVLNSFNSGIMDVRSNSNNETIRQNLLQLASDSTVRDALAKYVHRLDRSKITEMLD